MRVRPFLTTAALLGVAMLPCAARAGISVAGGGLTDSRSQSAVAAVLVSSGTSVPVVPLALQGSLLAPLTSNGGYAATFEVRGLTGGGYGGAYVGVGGGVGDLVSNQSAAPIFTFFAGKAIAPLTSIELRIYKQTRDEAPVTAGFVGLRFSF